MKKYLKYLLAAAPLIFQTQQSFAAWEVEVTASYINGRGQVVSDVEALKLMSVYISWVRLPTSRAMVSARV